MPKTLNPQNTFPTNIPNFPISGNDEPMTIEPLENAIQAVLNRSENLHVRLSEAETQGVKRVRTVASLAALSAATGFNNGDVCDVEGYGRYRLYNPSALTADGLWVLTATGGGRWVHTLRDMRGNGLATLDSGGRLAQDVRDASILTQHIGNSQVTSAKLAPGAVVGHLGYTPLNTAGDTITGDLTVNGLATLAGRTFRKVSFVPTSGVGWYRIIANTNIFGGRLDIYAEWNAQASRITLEGHSAGYNNTGYFNATQVYHYSGGLITQIRWGQSGGADAYLDIYVANVTNNNNTPINLCFWGDAWNGIQTSPAFNPAAGQTNYSIDITRKGGMAFEQGTIIARDDTMGWGERMISFHTESNVVQWAIGHHGVPGTGNTGNDFSIWRYDNNGNPLGQAFKLSRADGSFSGRYDHQNRFVVQGQLGGTTGASRASGSYTLSWINIYIPSGKRLYLKRLRYAFADTAVTARVFCQEYYYTSSSYAGDISLDVAMSNIGAGNVLFIIDAYTAGNALISPYDTVWAELEIR
ncbi:hypothetical protein [Meiothermus phage MMP17]|nr:hypothetical protein [Meiothermus phage MMP17]